MKNSLLRVGTIACLMLFSSCKWLLMKSYGIKQPKYESVKSIVKKSRYYGFDTSMVLVMNPYAVGSFFSRGIPEGEVFDRSGRYIEYKMTDTSCNAGLFGFLHQLKTDTLFRIFPERTLSKEIKRFRRMDKAPLSESYFKPADFYVFLTWAKWIGKLNKDHVKEWEKLIQKNSNAKIQLVLVNLDFMKDWTREEKDYVEKTLTKKNK